MVILNWYETNFLLKQKYCHYVFETFQMFRLYYWHLEATQKKYFTNIFFSLKTVLFCIVYLVNKIEKDVTSNLHHTYVM